MPSLVGSEMCIRDRCTHARSNSVPQEQASAHTHATQKHQVLVSIVQQYWPVENSMGPSINNHGIYERVRYIRTCTCVPFCNFSQAGGQFRDSESPPRGACFYAKLDSSIYVLAPFTESLNYYLLSTATTMSSRPILASSAHGIRATTARQQQQCCFGGTIWCA